MAKRDPQGFTLIEMMVALVVFSLAAMALIRLEGASFRTATLVDRSALANIVARNVAVDALTSATPPAMGMAQGTESNGGQNWRWSRNTSALGDGNALRIDVTVSDDQGRTAGRLMVVRSMLQPAATATAS